MKQQPFSIEYEKFGLGRNFPSAARITMFGCYISPEFCFLLLLFTVILSYLFVSDV
jgi:hypothetical protein